MTKLRAFTMPKWGIEMVEGTISEWNVKEGERVVKGQVIAQIETDKIVNEVHIEYDAFVVRLVAAPGQAYPVGALLAVTAGEAVAADQIDAFVGAFTPAGDAPSGAPSALAAAPASAAAPAAPKVAAVKIPDGILISPAARAAAMRLAVDVASLAGSGRRGRITLQDVEQAAKPARAVGGGDPVSIAVGEGAQAAVHASPYAQRLALAHGIDLASIRGTGPHGRVGRQDVARAAGIGGEAGREVVEILRMSPTRKAIARQLTMSKSTIPHFYLRAQLNFDALTALRADLKRAKGEAPSLNDYLIRAAALALMAAPEVNIQVHGEEIHRFRDADISVAVATGKGLITPVLRAAQSKPLAAISAELRALAERARSGRLRAEEIGGGSFTVSNLGMFGIEQFDAIINAPQGAILAVGAAQRRCVARGSLVATADVANVSLSCDHRAIDGAVGAGFLKALRELIEAPERL